MKATAFILGIALLSAGSLNLQKTTHMESVSTIRCLTKAEAEKILGQPANLTEQNHENKGGIDQYRCVYQDANVTTSRRSNLYYMLEVYKDESAAHVAYAQIVAANSSMSGQTAIARIGEEAWHHSDGENFHLIIFRRGNMMVRMKVNKITQTSSLDNLQAVARSVDQRVRGQGRGR